MTKSYEDLLAENEELRRSLDESKELLQAISQGEVDALVLSGREGEQVFTLEGADHAYRILIEAMNEGAVTITPDGTILYCNHRFAEMIRSPLVAFHEKLTLFSTTLIFLSFAFLFLQIR